MATVKPATLTFRIDLGLKGALRAAAAHEHCSIANMVEVSIRDYCVRNRITTDGKPGAGDNKGLTGKMI